MQNDDVYLHFSNYDSFSLQIRGRRTSMRKKKKTWLNANQRNVFCNTCLKWNVHKTFIIHLTYETAISWILVGEILKKAKKPMGWWMHCREWGQIREYKARYCILLSVTELRSALLDRVSLSDTAFLGTNKHLIEWDCLYVGPFQFWPFHFWRYRRAY